MDFTFYTPSHGCPICDGFMFIPDEAWLACEDCTANFSFVRRDRNARSVTYRFENFEDELQLIERVQQLAEIS